MKSANEISLGYVEAAKSAPGLTAQHRDVLGFFVYGAAYYFAYQYGMSFSQDCASPFWFPDSVLLCALLLNPPGRWWIFLVAALPIRLLTPSPWEVPTWFLLVTFLIDVLKGVLTASVLRHLLGPQIRLQTMRECAVFGLVAVLLVPALGAVAGAAARYVLGYDHYWKAWEQWFMGNVLTQLVITPAFFCWLFNAPGKIKSLDLRRGAEGVGLIVGLLVTEYIAFSTPSLDPFSTSSMDQSASDWRLYAPVPFLFWAAVRFGMVGASGAILLTALLAVGTAVTGRGYFSGRSAADAASTLQHFLLLRAVPLYLVALVIEQRTQIENSLRTSEEKFQHMADATHVLIWMAGPDKRCTYFNRRWLEFTGRTLEQEIDNGRVAHVHPEDLDHYISGYGAAFDKHRPFSVEYRMRRHDGQYRWMLCHANPRTTTEGEFLGYIGSCLDVTERKNDEAELQQNRQELVHLSRVSSLGALSTALAHELNQPLGSILSNAQAALRFLEHTPPNMTEVTEILRDIASEDQRAGEVIQRMRRLLKRGQPQYLPLDINPLLHDAVTLLRSELMHRGTKVDLQLGRNLAMVPGDRVSLQQVIINLLLNGSDAMQHLPVALRRLTVRTYQRQRVEVLIEVSDNGGGINPDDLMRLFTPFFTTKQHGLGVGLAISKSIMDAHGGRLWADNNLDRGATFHLALLIAPVAPIAPPQAQIENPASASPIPTYSSPSIRLHHG